MERGHCIKKVLFLSRITHTEISDGRHISTRFCNIFSSQLLFINIFLKANTKIFFYLFYQKLLNFLVISKLLMLLLKLFVFFLLFFTCSCLNFLFCNQMCKNFARNLILLRIKKNGFFLFLFYLLFYIKIKKNFVQKNISGERAWRPLPINI